MGRVSTLVVCSCTSHRAPPRSIPAYRGLTAGPRRGERQAAATETPPPATVPSRSSRLRLWSMAGPTIGRAARSPRPRRPSRVWFVATVLAAAPVAAVSVFRAVQVAWPRPVVQLLSFTPWLVLPAAVGLACAALSRRAWLLATTASLLALQLFWLFPLGHARPAQAADTRRVEAEGDEPQCTAWPGGRGRNRPAGAGQRHRAPCP